MNIAKIEIPKTSLLGRRLIKFYCFVEMIYMILDDVVSKPMVRSRLENATGRADDVNGSA